MIGLTGVRAVGTTGHLPLSGRQWIQPYGLPGQPEAEWAGNRADFRMVTSGYFEAMGTRILEGRTFTREEDQSEQRRVVVVDELLARRIAPGGSAVGRTLGIPLDGRAVEAQVVGVVEHVRYDALDADGREAIYVPYRQEASRDVSVVLRTAGDPAALAPAVRQAVRQVDAQLPVFGVTTLAGYIDANVAPARFAFTLAGAFAVLALLCAALGLYGVVALDVNRRRRDFGVRKAIGATSGNLVRSVLARGLTLAGAGLVAGAILAVPASRILASLLYGVRMADALTWAGVVCTVTVVTVAASALPAWRAGRVDPTISLRAE
jgi:predicted permease